MVDKTMVFYENMMELSLTQVHGHTTAMQFMTH